MKWFGFNSSDVVQCVNNANLIQNCVMPGGTQDIIFVHENILSFKSKSMKTEKFNGLAKSIFLGLLVIAMVIPFTSCAKKITFQNSTVVPSAKGHVKVKRDHNKNYIIKVEVSDLAEIDRVNSTKTTYVVWMETDEGNAENLGQLKSSTGFLSNRHKASLETVSSYNPVKIFITTENGTNVQFPGEQVVLRTETF